MQSKSAPAPRSSRSVVNASSKAPVSIRRAGRRAAGRMIEALESRQLLSIVTPSHIVVVIEEDRASNVIGDTVNMPYLNSLASTGLVYTNSHGLNTTSQQGELNYLALYSGSTQGVTDDGGNYTFTATDLADQLNAKSGLSFAGYTESLPSDGSQAVNNSGVSHGQSVPDLYYRAYNPMAMFDASTNAQVNKTFAEFPTNYANLPTVSFVIPNVFDNTHGSNEESPWAGSGDPTNNNTLRQWADGFLKQNLDAYLQWAKQNNSLLIITGDEGDRFNGFTSLATNDVTTVINGDPRLFVPGTDTTSINHYNVLRTIEDMYGLSHLGSAGSVADMDVNAQGQLAPNSGTAIASKTALASSAASAVFGQGVTLTATVTSTGSGTPAGTVTFLDGTTTVGTGTLNGSGVATFTTSSLSVASHSITASYAGSSTFLSSTSSALTETISKASTTNTLSSSSPSLKYGQQVTLTATLAAVSPGAGAPGGAVTFKDGTTTLGTGTLNSSGVATFSTSSLALSTHKITAVYSGSLSYAASTSAALTETVSTSSTTTVVTSSLSSSALGQAVTFTAAVAAVAPGSGTCTGTVQFQIDGANFGSAVTLSGGKATSASTSTLGAGTHTIKAVYSGDTHFITSTSAAFTQSVAVAAKSASTIALGTSAASAVFGQSITFTATVTSTASGTPTGTITFLDGTATLGVGSLNASGVATFTTTTLAVGPHFVTASYSGDGAFLSSVSPAVAEQITASSTALPAGWSDSDVGAPGVAGSATYNADTGTWTVNGGGADIWYTADQFNFASENFTGDGTIIANVSSITNTDPWTKAGVMFRGDGSAGAAFADVVATPGQGVSFQWRSTAGGQPVHTPTNTVVAPVWVKLSRSGSNFSAYYSTDGSSWIQIGSTQSVTMGSTALAGLAVTAHNNASIATAMFTHVTVQAVQQQGGALPSGWTDLDIGAPSHAGSAQYNSSTAAWSVTGGGSDIFYTSDQFNFASETYSGDGSIVAQVTSMSSTNPWAKAGVMFRTDSSAGSAFADVLATPGNGVSFQYRTTAGGSSAHIPTNAFSGPIWVKLTRSGNNFTAYYSTDGSGWIQLGSTQTIVMGTSALAGLAVTAHDDTTVNTATFSNVSVGP